MNAAIDTEVAMHSTRPITAGYGDRETFPAHVRAAEAREEREQSTWEQAMDIAHNAERVADLRAEGKLVDVQIKVDSEYRDRDEASELLRLRVLTGRYPEADCIARDLTDAIVRAVEKLIEEDRL